MCLPLLQNDEVLRLFQPQQPPYASSAAFTCFGVLIVLSRRLARFLRQDRWPTVVNIAINVAFVLGSFDVGFRIDRMV